MAPRLPLAATYNPQAVAEQLAARLGEGSVVTMAALESALDALLAAPESVVEGDSQAIDPELRARTAALRLKERFAARAVSDPGKLQLLSVQNVPSGRERIDFAAPAVVVVEQVISINPLSMARSMQRGAIDDVVKRLEIPPVPTGRQRLALSANLPEPIAGLQALVADFRAPEFPPFRPLAISASVSLDPPERRAEAELRLAPGEQLAGEVRLRAVVATNGEVVEIVGLWRAIQQANVLLGPADFGAPLMVLRVSPALAALAVVEVVANGSVVARLDTATLMTAIPLTHQDLRIFARPLAEGRDIAIEIEGKRRLDLDLSTLPGFGAHRARLMTTDAKPFIVEWRADGDTGQEPLSVRMGADRTVAEIGWLAASPFRPGVIWRTVQEGTPGPWSAPVLPQDELVIKIVGRTPMDDRAEPLVIDGVKIAAKNGDVRTWSYVPPRPSLERGPGGKPILTVIEAGSTAFLQCTTRLALHEDARAALLARLREIEPKAETLEAVPLSVERIALEVKTGSTWVAVAESKGSGMLPWTARHGVQTFSFRKADDIGKFTAFIEDDLTKFKYSYVVNYKGESRVFQSRQMDYEGNDLKINIDELGLWLVDVEVGDMNFEQVGSAVLTLEHPQVEPGMPPVCRFQIDKDNKKFEVKELRRRPAQPYTATIKYFMMDGREYVRELPDQKGQRFYVDDPFSATRVVQLRTRGDFERRIDTIFVDLTYDDERNGYRQTSSMALSKDKRFADWSFPVVDERAGKIMYHAIMTFKDGTSSDSGDQPISGTTLLLDEDTATLSVKLIPDLIDWSAVKLATIELHCSMKHPRFT